MSTTSLDSGGVHVSNLVVSQYRLATGHDYDYVLPDLVTSARNFLDMLMNHGHVRKSVAHHFQKQTHKRYTLARKVSAMRSYNQMLEREENVTMYRVSHSRPPSSGN